MSLISNLITSASAFAPLTALLGTSPSVFRMYPMQIDQGTAFPAVALQVISDSSAYVLNARLLTSTARVQATVFGATPGGENARSVVEAWTSFLDQYNGDGITGRTISPNRVVNVREFGIAPTQPVTWQIAIDADIFYNLQVTG